jgi:hypothetical protein
MVSVDKGMKGKMPFGYIRTSAGVVSAIEVMNRIGISTQSEIKMPTR